MSRARNRGLALLLLAPGLVGKAPAVELPLAPGRVVEGRLAPGGTDRYRLRPTPGARWLVRLEQLGLDAQMVLFWDPRGEPWILDSPLDREGTEFLLPPPGAVSSLILEVRGQSTEGGPGRYRLRLDEESEGRRLSAAGAMTRAGRGYAAGTGEGRQQALLAYGQALELWRALGEPRLVAESLYSRAVIYRLVGDGPRALELAREVLPLWRSLGDPGREADTWNEIGLLKSAAGRGAEARQAFREARAAQDRAGDAFRAAATTNNLCLTYLLQGEMRPGLECYQANWKALRESGDDETQATALTNMGRVYDVLGEAEQALAHHRQALALHRAAGRREREGEALNALGLAHQRLGEPAEALDRYLETLGIFRASGARGRASQLLHNLATVYLDLGDPRRALALLGQALATRQQLGDVMGQAHTLKLAGHVHLALGEPRQAEAFYRRSLAIEQQLGDLRGEGIALSFLGKAEIAGGQAQAALASLERALALLRRVEDRTYEALTLRFQGEAWWAVGATERAEAALTAALESFRALGHGDGEAAALYWLAETSYAAGQRQRALRRVEAAIARLESLRDHIEDPDLGAGFLAARRPAYELRLELLMASYASSGDARSLRAALEASEGARTQGLVELLRESGVRASARLPEGLAERLRAAQRQLQGRAELQRQKVLEGAPAARRQAAEAEFLKALAELERIEGEVRRADPASAELARPHRLGCDEIQALLDPGTLLLEVALGPRRSVLFAVTGDSLQAFELPARQVLEDGARQAWEALQSPSPSAADGAMERLAAHLLPAPLLARKDIERLVVVADGALHYIPFAALPLPRTSPEGESVPLLRRYEVVSLPSVSALRAERLRSEGRPSAPQAIAILADPVFDRNDLRLPPPPSEPRGPKSEGGERDVSLDLPRLRSSRREAEIAASLAPPGKALLALDFQAARGLALSARLAEYRIVHFATHGILDARYPALSGLMLSRFDETGRPQAGFLGLRDIYELKLSAELVVLSGCRTALGTEVRGEGLVGLTRGFLHAGARRVVASLWPVPDRATAELMSRFYRALGRGERSPAAALRQAQLSMLDERRWRDPHHWAAFVLQGEWRPMR